MKKNDQDTTLLDTDTALNKDLETNNVKTTNINILLNRVRLDRKRYRSVIDPMIAIKITNILF